MSATVKTVVVVEADSYGENDRVRSAVRAAAEILSRNPAAQAKALTVIPGAPARRAYSGQRLTLRFRMEETL